jgi:response regulator RpfG family c-di-GMP phosphodiesterase
MSTRTILLVQTAPEVTDALRTALAHEPRARLIAASDGAQALDRIARETPVLVFVDGGEDVRAALERCRDLRASAGASSMILALVVGQETAQVAAVAWKMGVDHVLGRPLSPAALHDALAAAFRIGDLRDRLEASESAVATLEKKLEESRRRIEELEAEQRQHEERIRQLLFGLLELGVPGAIDRGQRIAEMATKLAARFQVPAELLADLDLAARLHELGRMVVGSEIGKDMESASGHAWRYSQSTVAILERAGVFEGAADLIGGMYENWDGTGRPAHWQAGQIPLRCRILRVLVDWFAELESTHRAPGTLMESFEEHAGTLYDPLAVVHLKALIAREPEDEMLGQTLLLPVIELREGMVLVEDLYTDAGLKLLSRGTELTPTTLEIIQRRHRAEPILNGAAVRRPAA